MKQPSSFLRAIGLSAGLVASAAMMPSVHAATATITATGTVPVACSVNGASITMYKVDPKALQGSVKNVAYTTGSATTFSLSTPTLNAPSGYLGEAYIALVRDGSIVAQKYNQGDGGEGPTYFVSGAGSGVFTYEAMVLGGVSNVDLMPGNYTLSGTLTCVGE